MSQIAYSLGKSMFIFSLACSVTTKMSCSCKHCGVVLKDIRIARRHHKCCCFGTALPCANYLGAACDECFKFETQEAHGINFEVLAPEKELEVELFNYEAQV